MGSTLGARSEYPQTKKKKRGEEEGEKSQLKSKISVLEEDMEGGEGGENWLRGHGSRTPGHHCQN